MTKQNLDDSYDEIIAKNWRKIVDHLQSAIDIALENYDTEQAIRLAILLEEACKAWIVEEYSFEGKFNVR